MSYYNCCEVTKYFNELFSRRKGKYANQIDSKMLRHQNILFAINCGTIIKRIAYIRYPRIKHYRKSEGIEREKFNKIELLYSVLMDNTKEKKSLGY